MEIHEFYNLQRQLAFLNILNIFCRTLYWYMDMTLGGFWLIWYGCPHQKMITNHNRLETQTGMGAGRICRINFLQHSAH